MSTFTLGISCLTTSNLPWFMDLTFQVPMQYCSLQHLVSITSHIHSWVLFLLWLHPFIFSGVISLLISSSILGTYWSGEFLFQYPIILPLCRVFSCVVGKGCFLWPMHFLGKTLLIFALLHCAFKAKFACYSRYFLTSYFCIPVPYNEKDIFVGC